MKVYKSETINEICSLIDSVKHRMSPKLIESSIARNTFEIIENKLTTHEVKAECEECGELLEIHFSDGLFQVEPCRHCLDTEGEKAVDQFREYAEMQDTYDSLNREVRQTCRRRA